ncbi:MAG: prenyltransferase [Methylotenera sp.]|nr:prenyltransferase [Methylotenera sp.]
MGVETEPSVKTYSSVIKRYFFATRPAFLLATFAACALGLAGARFDGVSLQPTLAFATVLLALLVHAAVNVLNDYFDACNGGDALNVERLYPYTGGSRFIQNGLITPQKTAQWGYVLLAVAMLGGLYLVMQVGLGLLMIGSIGVFIAWAYSAPPLRLNSRGLGELCVLLGFLGLVIGTDFVQRGSVAWQPIFVGLPYALLATNLLFINQFPDYKADALVGKRHWVVRLSPARAVKVYLWIVILAFICLLGGVIVHVLPLYAVWSAIPLVYGLRASQQLKQFYATPQNLCPAIQYTLRAMLMHTLFFTLILCWVAK